MFRSYLRLNQFKLKFKIYLLGTQIWFEDLPFGIGKVNPCNNSQKYDLFIYHMWLTQFFLKNYPKCVKILGERNIDIPKGLISNPLLHHTPGLAYAQSTSSTPVQNLWCNHQNAYLNFLLDHSSNLFHRPKW